MTRSRHAILGLALPLAAVLVFAVLLTFSMLRMFEMQNAMRVGAEQNMLWVLHQSEVAALRMIETAALAELGEADQDDLALRLDILASRVTLLNDGPQRRFVERIGMGGDLDRLQAILTSLKTIIDEFTQDDGPRLRNALAPFSGIFGRAANKAMIAEWDDMGGRLEASRGQLHQIIASLIGIMIAGGILAVMLVMTLRESRQRNRMLLRERDFSGLLISSSGEGILAVNRDIKCTVWNDAIAGMIGKPAEQVVGRTLSQVAGFFETAPVRIGIEQALAGITSKMAYQPLFAPDRERPLYVDLRFYPMWNDVGIVGAILFMHDASDRHAAKQREAQIRDRLEELVTERTRDLDSALQRERSAADLYRNFAAMVSHQFRTPLAVADSALQRLLRRGPRADPGEVAERAGRARSAIAGLTRLVESTLDAARLDAGQIGARRVNCDMSKIVRTVCDRLGDAAPDRHIEVSYPLLGQPIAYCDPALAEQVLENLLSNANKYAPPNTLVSVVLRIDGEWLYCDVSNSGPSLSEEDREQIFERNHRGANSVGVAGTGIGLFMARTLARMQGGDVTLQAGNEGTTFRISLPRFEEKTT
ncbi:histidine kinase,PAS domain-containing protein,histidine kinase [Hoeflea sp. IMCC20628]|uniref:sensor histidine kinase n=1 Tax=Hoeflea sp. IMCC20628 TaxID=1620421 RepID=UPI00063AB927|nr:PAS domain-containing sensor histidine kinase [Hoeflea sp. IMCC20628]AKI01809.1 histidine kinase,PAS domain-containing protein,histidine kinase [Hoeflea sp. IMCC20628]